MDLDENDGRYHSISSVDTRFILIDLYVHVYLANETARQLREIKSNARRHTMSFWDLLQLVPGVGEVHGNGKEAM
jgi:hypothetical protein